MLHVQEREMWARLERDERDEIADTERNDITNVLHLMSLIYRRSKPFWVCSLKTFRACAGHGPSA